MPRARNDQGTAWRKPCRLHASLQTGTQEEGRSVRSSKAHQTRHSSWHRVAGLTQFSQENWRLETHEEEDGGDGQEGDHSNASDLMVAPRCGVEDT